MITKIVKPDEYKVSEWSGGTTKQLYLYPENAEFEVGAFDYRISSAEVMLDTSVFTSLPGYQRIIMPLKNQLRLVHEVEEIELAEYQTHYFDGDERTVSYGKCTDFNLIYKPEYTGEMKALSGGEQMKVAENTVCYFYALEQVTVNVADTSRSQEVNLHQNELLIIEGIGTTGIKVQGDSDDTVGIIVTICK